MTTQFFEIGGARRPIRYGYQALYCYEQRTGRSAIEDFAKLGDNTGGVSVTMMVDLVVSGLEAGYRAEKIPRDFDDFEVAGWLGERQELFQEIVGLFADSFPKGEEKKTKPRQATARPGRN